MKLYCSSSCEPALGPLSFGSTCPSSLSQPRKQRRFEHAAFLYRKMQEGEQRIDRSSIVALLKACASFKEVDLGSKLHGEISELGFLRNDLYVGNALVDMYCKCNSLRQARQAFDMLPARDVVSWNTLIAGYARLGHGNKALECFHQMQDTNIQPNAITYVCCLKACGIVRNVGMGRELHALILRQALLRENTILCNALVEMYARCGCTGKAQEMFEKLPVRDVFSWNALISGYSRHGEGEKALLCFKQMQLNAVYPDVVTFLSILKASGSLEGIQKGNEVHAEIARLGFLERDLKIGNALVDMYAKHGLLSNAREVFENLPRKDVITWTTLIGGYARHEFAEDALDCYTQMKLEGFSPNAVTLTTSLRACTTLGAMHVGIGIHAEAARKGYLEGGALTSVGNALIDMYAKCGSIVKAEEVFKKLPIQDSVSWTALIMGHVEYQRFEEALIWFERMRAESVSPNSVTYMCSLKACGCIKAVDKGKKIHVEVGAKGLSMQEEERAIGNVLIDMYAHCGCLVEARKVLGKLCDRDVVSWTAMIAGYVKHGCGEDALDSFEKMKAEKISPNAVTVISILKACCMLGAIQKGQEMHIDIARKGLLERDLVVGNALVDMYAKCGSVRKAQQVFNLLPVRDVITWNALIAGYTQSGESENAFDIFEKMRASAEQPDMVTFLCLLNACSQVGMVHKGQACYEVMSKDYGMTPTLKHYTCMVNLVCRAGHLARAKGMLSQMGSHPDHVMWHCILDASTKWGNMTLCKEAYERVMELEDKDPSPYVSMCSMLADPSLML